MHDASDLHGRWTRHAARLGIAPREGGRVWQALVDAYASPPRAYHSLAHVGACLRDLDEAAPGGAAGIETAVWFHDAVYQPLRSDNEARSADLMRALLGPLGVDPQILHDAHRLIMVTAHHAGTTAEDEAVIADVDLAVLAGDPAAYDRYADAIREEYGAVTDDQYAAGRARFLTAMLESPSLYRTAWAGVRGLEARARTNMGRELERLGGHHTQ